MLIGFEEMARALDFKSPRGSGVAVFCGGQPCLEPKLNSCHFILHRHRAGARKVRRILRRARQARYAAWSADVKRRFQAALAEFPDDMQRAAVPRILCGRAAMRDASLASPIPGEFYPVSPWAIAAAKRDAPPGPAPQLRDFWKHINPTFRIA